MNRRVVRCFKIVVAAHLVLLMVTLFSGGGCRLRRRKPETVIPIEFTVALPAATPDAAPASLPVPEPAPKAPPPTPPRPEPVPEPPPRPRPPRIERSTRRVTRGEPRATEPQLSEEDIRRLLAEGATVSDRTVIPSLDAQGMARVREVLYRAWQEPARSEAGRAEAILLIELGSGGQIVNSRLASASGNAILDQSVLQAVSRVQRISGLPAGFEERHRELRISFRVE